MTEPVRLGFIGSGGIASLMAAAATELDDVDVVACTARTKESAERFAAEHRVACAYADVEEMLTDPTVDAVYIASPNGLHFAQTVAALEAGKHVLVEKPFALSVSQAMTMAQRADDLGLRLGVGFHLRHHEVFTRLKELLDEGALGTPELVRASWGMSISGTMAAWKNDREMAGAGAIMGLAVHIFDLACWLLGRLPTRVAALSDGDQERLDKTFLAVLDFSDLLVRVEVSRRYRLEPNGLVIHGTEGTVHAHEALTMESRGELTSDYQGRLLSTSSNPYVSQLKSFASSVRGETSFHADGWDGLRSVEVTEAAIAAAGSAGRFEDLIRARD